jgi:predicted RNase H-like nuclease
MRMGFSLYRGLENFGYQDFPKEGAQCQLVEVYPHASFAVLLGLLPFPKNTLEGRMQRQLILFEKGVQLPDPMEYFKEITRSRLLSGSLPLGDLYSSGELDALVAAYSAWHGYSKPDQITLFGDPEEGQILVPEKRIKARYT